MQRSPAHNESKGQDPFRKRSGSVGVINRGKGVFSGMEKGRLQKQFLVRMGLQKKVDKRPGNWVNSEKGCPKAV